MPPTLFSPDRPALVRRLRAAGCVFAEDEADLLIAAAGSAEALTDLVDRRVAGLYDAGEEGYVRRVLASRGTDLSSAGIARLGFHACRADLEDELIRALGTPRVEELVEAAGDLRSLRRFQRQPAQQKRPLAGQLRRFIGTRSGRKSRYATLLADALDPARTPAPLDRLLAQL
ncbi:hypothetical protein GCM10027452_36950 [Micromonospora halotolerans]